MPVDLQHDPFQSVFKTVSRILFQYLTRFGEKLESELPSRYLHPLPGLLRQISHRTFFRPLKVILRITDNFAKWPEDAQRFCIPPVSRSLDIRGDCEPSAGAHVHHALQPSPPPYCGRHKILLNCRIWPPHAFLPQRSKQPQFSRALYITFPSPQSLPTQRPSVQHKNCTIYLPPPSRARRPSIPRTQSQLPRGSAGPIALVDSAWRTSLTGLTQRLIYFPTLASLHFKTL